MMYHLEKPFKINKNGRYFIKMAVIQYIADRVLFAVVIDCGTLWSFSCGTWMPLYVDIIKGSHPEYTYKKYRFNIVRYDSNLLP